MRVGWSDGTAPPFNWHFSGWFIYLFPQHCDLIGFSAALDTLATPGLGDQTTLEAFYRYQFSDDFARTADAQLLINLALHPTKDQITVFGPRTRFNM